MTTPLLQILLSFYFVTHILSNFSTMFKPRSYEFYSGKAAVHFFGLLFIITSGETSDDTSESEETSWLIAARPNAEKKKKILKTLFNVWTFLKSDRFMYLTHNMYFSSTRGLSIRTKQKMMTDDVAQDHSEIVNVQQWTKLPWSHATSSD